jgi:hypothetical protein
MAPFWPQHDGMVIVCTGCSGFLLGRLPAPILNLRLLKPLAGSCQRTPLSHAPLWRAVVKIALTLSRLKIFCSSKRNTCCGLVFSTTRMVKRVSDAPFSVLRFSKRSSFCCKSQSDYPRQMAGPHGSSSLSCGHEQARPAGCPARPEGRLRACRVTY